MYLNWVKLDWSIIDNYLVFHLDDPDTDGKKEDLID